MAPVFYFLDILTLRIRNAIDVFWAAHPASQAVDFVTAKVYGV
ncbi:hypothetical protein J2T18_004671 [Paenibacillus polymyxa]|nr:hypothetical protein [Paenibacillus polymyxa]